MNFMQIFFIVIALVTAGIVASITAQVIADVEDDQTADSLESNISLEGLQAIETMSTKFNLLATVAIAGIIISTLLFYFSFKTGGGQ